MIFKNSELQAHFDYILDTFSGSDGGIRFVKFKCMLTSLEKQADLGDESAKKILEVMIHFSRLINVTNEVSKYEK